MYTILFMVGIVELYISALLTKSISKERAGISGVITFVNILIWYFVLRTILEQLDNTKLVVVYALGCSLGTILGAKRGNLFAEILKRVQKLHSRCRPKPSSQQPRMSEIPTYRGQGDDC